MRHAAEQHALEIAKAARAHDDHVGFFLIRRGQESAVLTRVAPVVARAAGVAVVPTAPRPPYAFVPPLDAAPWSVPAEPVRPATILAG